MFIDYAVVKVISGKGGDGVSSFRREKYVPKGGPDGGDGGKGGSVIFTADRQLSTLVDIHFNKIYRAQPGVKGKGSNMNGRNADDLVVKVPEGTVIKEKETGRVIKDLVRHGESLIAAKGGRGGRGNVKFKTSTRQAPRFYEKGEPGEEKELILELKILADVGLLGMANAGKSTILSKISNAHPKTANYPFTTLSPVLGLVKIDAENSFVAADIPGLIEGSAEGRGLGIEFLKHIERTKLYIHVVDPTQGDAVKIYRAINNELGSYNENLTGRPQAVVINKSDLLSDKEKKKIKDDFKKEKVTVDFISAKEGIGLEKVIKKVYNKLKKLPKTVKQENPGIIVEEGSLKLDKLDANLYRLSGKRLERYVAMLDFNNDETLEVFRRYLKNHGINDYLSKKGVKEGDIIVINDMDFVYREDE